MIRWEIMPVLSDGGNQRNQQNPIENRKNWNFHILAKTYPIDLKLGQKLDINERNDSDQKNPTSDVVTSCDVTMTSSPILKIKNTDLSTILTPFTTDMYFSWKRISKHKKWGVNRHQRTFCWKVMTNSDLTDFDDVITVMTSLWRHHDRGCDKFGRILNLRPPLGILPGFIFNGQFSGILGLGG